MDKFGEDAAIDERLDILGLGLSLLLFCFIDDVLRNDLCVLDLDMEKNIC